MMIPVTKKEAEIKKDQLAVLSVAEGFFQSSILFALMKLRVFERIGDGSSRLADLATELGTRPDTLARLLNAGVVLQLLDTEDGNTYRVASAARSVLIPSAGENYLGNWIRNLDYFRSALSQLDEAVLKSNPMVDPTTYMGADGSKTREYTLAMHNYASVRGKELARFLDTTGCDSLLDLGCGPGTYAFHLGSKNPHLKLYLLDMPGVLEIAREVRERFPLESDTHYLPLDALIDEIPGSYDMILVSNILHMLGEMENRELIKRLFRSVNPGGSLVIQAQYLNDNRRGGRWPVFLDLIQLCITAKGTNHSVRETRQWMEDAGFERIMFCPMTMLNTNSFLRGYRT